MRYGWSWQFSGSCSSSPLAFLGCHWMLRPSSSSLDLQFLVLRLIDSCRPCSSGRCRESWCPPYRRCDSTAILRHLPLVPTESYSGDGWQVARVAGPAAIMGLVIAILLYALSVLSVPLAVYGLLERSPLALGLSAAATLPLALYLYASPAFRAAGLLLPLPLIMGAAAVKRRDHFAWVLVAPFLVAMATLFVLWARI